jgi:hypothetical protein
MKKVKIVKDFALLDKGIGEENPFVIIEGAVVNDNGSLVDPQLGRKAMSNEAVRKGATRINASDCVDITTGGSEAYDDKVIVFNGGDIYEPYDADWARKAVENYSPEDKKRALEYINHREARYKFMVSNGLIEELNIDKKAKGSFIDDVKEFLGI